MTATISLAEKQRHGFNLLPAKIYNPFETFAQRLAKTITEEGGTVKVAPAEKSALSGSGQTFEWSLASFGTVTFKIDKFTLGTRHYHGRLVSYSEVLIDGEPRYLVVETNVKPVAGMKVIFIKEKNISDVTRGDIPLFKEDMRWHKRADGKRIPETNRKGDADTFDIVLLNPADSSFVQIAFFVRTSGDSVFVGVQEMYAGYPVRTTKAKAEKLGVEYIADENHVVIAAPMCPEHTQPGSDYIKNQPAGNNVLRYAVMNGISIKLSECPVAEWSPRWIDVPADLAMKGYKKAVVLWYCAVIGYGFAILEDGTSCKIGFKAIIDDNNKPLWDTGRFPVLVGMEGIFIRYRTLEGRRNPEATAIKLP